MIFYTTHSIYTGYVLLKIREELGFKQQRAFAKFINMSHTGLGKIERGETGTTVEHLYMMAALIGTTPDEILKCVNLVIEKSTESHKVVVMSSSDFNKLHSQLTENEMILDHNELSSILSTDVQIEILKIIKKKVNEKVLTELMQEIEAQENQCTIAKESSENGLNDTAIGGARITLGEGMAAAAIMSPTMTTLSGEIGLGIAAIGTGLGLLISKRNKKAP